MLTPTEEISHLHAVDYEEISVGAAAVGLSTTKLATQGLFCVHVRTDTATVVVRLDGTDPTAAVGTPMYDLDNMWMNLPEAVKFKAIRQGGTNGNVRAHYYKKV